MPTGPAPKGPRLWLEPERVRPGRKATPAHWSIRDDGGFKRSLECGPQDRAAAEVALKDYIAEKHAIAPGERSPSQRLTSDILNLYGRDVAPDHARPNESADRIDRLLTFWGDPVLAAAELKRQNIRGESVSGFASDVRTAVCRAYFQWAGGNRLAALDLEMLRTAINHAVADKKLDRPITVWLPEKAPPRDRWLTRSEAAAILWQAWRQKRKDLAADRWPLLPKALSLRDGGRTAAQIADALGCTRNKVAGQLWRHDQRQKNENNGLATTRHVARFILVVLYTGKRKAAALAGAFERMPGFGYVDLDHGLWHPPPGRRKTNKRQHPQPIPPTLLAHMRRWHRNGQRFVIEYSGQPVEEIDRSLRAIVRKLGLKDVVEHTFRHTAITWGLQNGMEIWDASGFFSVSIEVLEKVYGHHSVRHLREAATIMSRPQKRRPRDTDAAVGR